MTDTKQEILNRKRPMELKKWSLFEMIALHVSDCWLTSNTLNWSLWWRQSSSKNSHTVIHTLLHNYLKTNTVQHSHLVLCTWRGEGGGVCSGLVFFHFLFLLHLVFLDFFVKNSCRKKGKKTSKVSAAESWWCVHLVSPPHIYSSSERRPAQVLVILHWHHSW